MVAYWYPPWIPVYCIINADVNKFDKCEKLKNYINKYIAHAHDLNAGLDKEDLKHKRSEMSKDIKLPFNQTGFTKDIDLTLELLDECYKEIYVATRSIFVVVGESISLEVPTPQFDVFENIAKPMAKESDIEKLQESWHKRVEEVRQFTH